MNSWVKNKIGILPNYLNSHLQTFTVHKVVFLCARILIPSHNSDTMFLFDAHPTPLCARPTM